MSPRRHLHIGSVLVLLMLARGSSAHDGHPLGKRVLDWRSDPIIDRTLSLNYDAHAGRHIVAWRPGGEIQSIAGRDCLVGPYFLFDIDDSRVFDTDTTATVELLFDRESTNGFYIGYDRVREPAARKVVFDRPPDGRWHRVTVELERARFANRKYEGTDLSVGALGTAPPYDADDGATITLCGLSLQVEANTRSVPETGRLQLLLANENGTPGAARVGLYGADGWAPLPGDDALSLRRYGERVRSLSLLDTNPFWPGEGRFVFYVDGRYRARLPAGTYQLVVSKGPEYRLLQQQIRIEPGRTLELNLRLERWMDLPSAGWYSGDGHIHLARADAAENREVLAFTRAEDIHVANLLQMGNLATWYYPQYAFGEGGQFLSRGHALVSGQESPRTAHLGHTIGLNGQTFHWPEKSYYVYQATADAVHREGGLFGFAHVALADAFPLQRGLPLGVALGYVDFLEILQMGVLNTRYLYDFLNLGFHLLPSAGSDYPYIHIAGSERLYVHVPGEFSPSAWFDAWSSGRSFVSNGPVLTFTVNGDAHRARFDIDDGEALAIRARAMVNPDFDELAAVELVVQGAVVDTARRAADGVIRLNHELRPGQSTWFALRARGRGGSVAHTSPVYVQVDGDPRTWKRDQVAEIARRYIAELQALPESVPDPYGDFEVFDTQDAIGPRWNAARPTLRAQATRATGIYRDLIEDARRDPPGR